MKARLLPALAGTLIFWPVFFPPLPGAEDTVNPAAEPVEDRVDDLADPNAHKLMDDKDIEARRQAAIIGKNQPAVPPPEGPDSGMKLASSAFKANGMIPAESSFDGGNTSPPLEITGVPAAARSLAVICEDPDAERGAPWIHWVVWDIGPQIGHIPQGKLPEIAQAGVNSWGRNGWGGPAPPKGTHHYVFTLYALDAVLHLPETTDAKALRNAMEGHVLGTATLTGRYSAPE